MAICFDDSLPALITALINVGGEQFLEGGVALRDARGQLTFFSPQETTTEEHEAISKALRASLGNYARSDRVFADLNDFGTSEIFRESLFLNVDVAGHQIRLVDRRLVGGDWLRRPVTLPPPPPRFVFSSLKGGVGRSTALCVAAADFSSQGRRVLAIDLDMEAPGLGSILLENDTLPEFGIVDALVESKFENLSDLFIADLVAPTRLAAPVGRIEVIPAFGKRSQRNPADVLAKISRAYTETVTVDGHIQTLLDTLNVIITRLADPARYDVILLDARSGLNETSASSILGLGADVLLFGSNDNQTFEGYRALFAHLARLPQTEASNDLVDRLTLVHAKAPANRAIRNDFRDKSRQLFFDSGLIKVQAIEAHPQTVPTFDSISDVPWTDDYDEDPVDLQEREPNEPLIIMDDERFRYFNPLESSDLLRAEIYDASYRPFLDRLGQAFPRTDEIDK